MKTVQAEQGSSAAQGKRAAAGQCREDSAAFTRSLIHSDLYRYTGQISRKALLKCLWQEPGFRYTYLLRKTRRHYLQKNQFRFQLYRLLLRRYKMIYGYEIPYQTAIGKGFYIGHLGGIAVNPRTVIGSNVNIHKGVTIGKTNRGQRQGCPTIGNQVWIGANAVIVGKVQIGDNVLIAPGAYVNTDVPSHAIVLGNPGQIHESVQAVEGYINHEVPL